MRTQVGPKLAIRVRMGKKDGVDMTQAVFREPFRGRWQEALPDIYHNSSTKHRRYASELDAALGLFQARHTHLGCPSRPRTLSAADVLRYRIDRRRG